jgi:predicted dehydrogenase
LLRITIPDGSATLKKIRFGVAGSGGMAARMVQTLQRSSSIEIKAIASQSVDRARAFINEERLKNVKPYSYFESNFFDEIDALYIATSNAHHFGVAELALSRRIPVLVEKPMSLDYKSSKQLVDIAAEYNTLLMEALWIKFLPTYQRLLREVNSNSFGAIKILKADFGYKHYPEKPSSLTSENQGVINDRLIYPLALALDFLGDIRYLQVASPTLGSEFDSNIAVQICHVGGAISQLAVSRDVQLANQAMFYGDKAIVCIDEPLLGSERLVVRPVEYMHTGHGKSKKGIRKYLKQIPLARRLMGRFRRDQTINLSYGDDQYLPMLEHFTDLLIHGKKQSEIHSLGSTLKIAETIEKVRTLRT